MLLTFMCLGIWVAWCNSHISYPKGAAASVNKWQASAVGQVSWLSASVWQNQIPGMLHFPNPGSILSKLFLPSTHCDCVLSDLCPIGFPKFYDCIYRIANIPLNIWFTQPASILNEERPAVVYWMLTTCHALRQRLCVHYLIILPSHLWDGICYVHVTEGKKTNAQLQTQGHTFFFARVGF